MRERIDITVPDSELALNDEKRERMRRARAFNAMVEASRRAAG